MKLLRKVFVALIIIFPVFASTDCKKQPKCGCDGDVVGTLSGEQASVYFNESRTYVYFFLVRDSYSRYELCNPSEIVSSLTDIQNGDIVLVSGHAYWECNFLYQSSNYNYYTSMSKVYQVQVTKMVSDLYGKK